MDLKAVLGSPKGEVFSIFYKRKLAVYNLTIFNVILKEGTCVACGVKRKGIEVQRK